MSKKKQKRNKMSKFNYIKFVTEHKHILKEGIRIDTSGDVPTFDISASDIEGEQLSRVDGVTKKADHNVFYSLESAEGVENVKHFMDILKNNPENIDDSSMMNLIKRSLKGQQKLEEVTYVAYLGSSQPLSRKIALWVKQIYGTEDIIKISKNKFKEIRHQIDHEIYSKQAPSIKNSLSRYVSTRSDDEDKSMKKTGRTQGSILSKLVNKYLLSPEKTRGEAPPIYKIIRNCIMSNSTLLIVDDNIHAGNDFLKVMREIDLIKESLTEAYKDNKYIHTTINTSRHRIQGYTLYKLQDKDLREEMNINELTVEDPGLQEQIERFANLSEQINNISEQLNTLKNEYSSIEGALRPVLEEMEETEDISLIVENIIITIKRKGHDRTSIAYKEAFKWLRERVNPAMQRIVEEALKATEKTTRIVSKIGVQRVDEGLLDKLKNFWDRVVSGIRNTNSQLKADVEEFKVSLNESKTKKFDYIKFVTKHKNK